MANESLSDACVRGHTETVRTMLLTAEYGRSADLESPLCLAAVNGHTEIVGILLKYKANVHGRGFEWDGFRPDHPLRFAAYNGHSETVRVLLEAHADVHACGSSGIPDHALRKAVERKHPETVVVLLHAASCDSVAHLTPSFIDAFLNSCTATCTIANTARCMRLGAKMLKALSDRADRVFRMQEFSHNRDRILNHISDHCCRDLCELVLVYV